MNAQIASSIETLKTFSSWSFYWNITSFSHGPAGHNGPFKFPIMLGCPIALKTLPYKFELSYFKDFSFFYSGALAYLGTTWHINVSRTLFLAPRSVPRFIKCGLVPF